MPAVYHIAVNTFKETIRNKVLYNILLFAVAIIFLSMSFGDWSVFARMQVVQDFGLATMSVSGLMLAVFIGVGLLGREISSKTVYTVLANPFARIHFIAGKWLGLLFTLFLNYAIMSAFFGITLHLMGGSSGTGIWQAIFLVWIEMALIVSVAVLFSTFTTPTLAAIFTIAFYIAGHYNDLLDMDMVGDNVVYRMVLQGIYYLLPNLEHFNIRPQVVYNLSLPDGYVMLTVLYGACYCVLFLSIAGFMFNRKDL